MMMKRFIGLMAGILLLLCVCGAVAEEIVPEATPETISLSVNAFVDSNHNAERGVYETAYTDLYAELLLVEGKNETLVAEAKVNADGVALFDNLEKGTYRVRTTCGEGYGYTKKSKKSGATSNVMDASSDRTQTSGDIKLSKGKTEVGVAIRMMAKLTGVVWLDSNGDGIRNNGEGGIAGAVLEMEGTKNGMKYQLVTDETGEYCFSQIYPGSYKLYCTVPEGTAFTKHSDVGGSARSIFTASGKTRDAKTVDLNEDFLITNQNVGVVKESTIKGICYLDANYNGKYDEGEPALSGVKLELTRQANSKSAGKATSAKDGSFSFGGLRSYVYALRAVLPVGYYFTQTAGGERGNRFRHLEDRREYTLSGIQLDTEQDLTLYIGAVAPAVISGTVYLDNDFSGARNGKEQICSGISVGLYNSEGVRVDATKTTAKGKYTFENVNPGEYYITCIAKTGYAFTKVGAGNVMLNTGNGKGATSPFWIGLGDKKTDADIGMILPGTVQGCVYADANDNGHQDGSEKGFAGTVVSLVSEEGVEFSTTLDASGAYVFDAVMPGKYCVRYQLPEGSVFATKVGDDRPESSEADSKWFKFATGDQVTMEIVGGVQLGSVSGIAFEDANADGVMTENALAGMQITLTPSRSDLQAVTAVSGEDGYYLLDALHPDTYTMTVTWPEGYVQSRTAGTTLPVKSGLAEQSAAFTVSMGDRRTEQNLGGVRPGSLAGRMWLDANNNGILDADESGISGESVQVIDLVSNQVFAVLTTGEDGSFSSVGMIPGTYRLVYGMDSNTLPAPSGDSTFQQDGSQLVMDGIQLATGDAISNVMLGVVRYTSISGHVWVDNGGEIASVKGAKVTLSGDASAEYTTGEDGNYVFGGLMPGSYQLSVRMPDGTVVVDADDVRLEDGSLTSVMTQTNGRDGVSGVFALQMAKDLRNTDIGGVLPGRLGDKAWLDLNGNGLQDIGEEGIPGVRITLLRDGVEVDSVVTDQYGLFFFTNVYPAVYTMRVDYPTEVKPTILRDEYTNIVSVLLEDGSGTLEVTVESSKRNYNADLGFVLIRDGVYPAGYGEGDTMNWSPSSRNDLRTN